MTYINQYRPVTTNIDWHWKIFIVVGIHRYQSAASLMWRKMDAHHYKYLSMSVNISWYRWISVDIGWFWRRSVVIGRDQSISADVKARFKKDGLFCCDLLISDPSCFVRLHFIDVRNEFTLVYVVMLGTLQIRGYIFFHLDSHIWNWIIIEKAGLFCGVTLFQFSMRLHYICPSSLVKMQPIHLKITRDMYNISLNNLSCLMWLHLLKLQYWGYIMTYFL